MAKHILLSTILFVIAFTAQGQLDERTPLFIELKKQDSLFFEKGFNQCDISYLDQVIAKDLRFYHDRSGVQDRDAFFANTQKYICGNSDIKPIRKLQSGSLTVFPLYNQGVLYGAIQSGVHLFYIREPGKADEWTNTARFTSVWTLENQVWKLSEVLSYDHRDPRLRVPEQNTLEQLLKDNNVPALGLGIINNGKLTDVKVYGTLDKQVAAPQNAIFKVASLTKPLVAVLTLKLIDSGFMRLDEPLYKYWNDPDLKKNKWRKKLTPRIVLSHQTGFPNWRYMTEANKLAFQFEPGTSYQYSGEGFEYLRKAIENKLGKSIEALAHEFVFVPAGMTDTRFWWDSSMDETRYAQNFDANGQKIPTSKYYKANAAANLLTTAEDYGKFIEYVVNGAELSGELFGEMQRHQVKLKENDYFGLGWEILTGFPNEEFALLHTGKDPGVNTLAIFFPKSKNGYLLFLNGDNFSKVYEELLTKHLYLGEALWNKR